MKHTEEFKKRLSIMRMGSLNPMYGKPATKGSFKKGYCMRDKNPNWKGGISSPECSICKKRLSYGAKTCIAHRPPVAKGIYHPAYKNGSTPLRKKIERLIEYKNWHSICLIRDDYTCQICFKRGGDLQIDHIKALALIIVEKQLFTIADARLCKELWDTNNGRALCAICHRKLKTHGYGTRRQLWQISSI